MTSGHRISAEAVVFDQGNTLLMDPFNRVMDIMKDRFREICADFGYEIDPPRLQSSWSEANRDVHYPFIGHFVQEEPIVQEALRRLDVPPQLAVYMALELLREYRTGLERVAAEDPRTLEVRDTLEALKARGKRLGVFSNDRTVGLGLALHAMGVSSLFEYIRSSESIGAEKPSPDVFDDVLKHFELAPNSVVYVGDDPARDVDAAKDAGLKAILYRVPNGESQPWRSYSVDSVREADATVEHFSQLLEVID